MRELVEGVLDELDLEGEVEINEDDEAIEATVVGEDDYGLLIGRRGQTIDALQLLCHQAAFRGIASASASSSTPPATATAAARSSQPAPPAPPSRR